MSGVNASKRVDWVDYAKGFCIVFVVMMHSTLGVEQAAGAEGWMHHLVAFAKPFRMPDFFLISGLFLPLVINRDWKTYIDRKVVHFAYFYVLWVTIQFAFKLPAIQSEHGALGALQFYLLSFVEPFGTLWFIYLLPIFFVIIKLTKNVSPWIIWPIAAALEISHLNTGWMVPDEFAARFVYTYTGYVLANHIFGVASKAQKYPRNGLLVLAAWGIANGTMVFLGYSDLPFISLALGLIGAAAVVRIAALLSLTRAFAFLRYLGEHSIVIYLAFFLPMAISRTLLLKTGLIDDIGTISVIVTAFGVIGAVLMYWALRATPLNFLYERPRAFWLRDKPKSRVVMQPAE